MKIKENIYQICLILWLISCNMVFAQLPEFGIESKVSLNTQKTAITQYEKLKWVLFNGTIPELALKIGTEANGEKQCACLDTSTKRVGKFLVNSKECLYGSRGKEVSSKKFHILTGIGSSKLEKWDEKIASGSQPYPKAVKLSSGNMTLEIQADDELGLLTQEKVYLGIFEYKGGQHIGRIYDHRRFVITYGGQTIWGTLLKKESLRPTKILVGIPQQ